MKQPVFFILSVLAVITLALTFRYNMGWAADEGHEHGKEKGSEKITVIGEVIDPICYIRHESRGPEHKKCAEYCAKQGITLAVLNEQNDEILLAFPVGHGDPNEQLMPHIAQRVKVTGTIWEKSGLKGIEIKSVEPLTDN